MSIKRCSGVYEPDDDTYMLMDIEEIKGKLLEIGSGTGIISIHYAKRGCQVTAIDILDRAVKCTYVNAKENNVKINVVRTSLFNGIKGIFDFCIFNPPYLPEEYPKDVAWDGGKEGNELIKLFIDEGIKYCRKLYFIESSLAPVRSELYQDLKFNYVRSITYDFEELHLVRVESHAEH